MELVASFLSFCKTCQKQTKHEIRQCEGSAGYIKLCIPCLNKAIFEQLGRGE